MDEERIRVRIAGMRYPNDDGSNRGEIARKCSEGEQLVLKHTPVPQDKNGVRVLRQNGEQLGWLPRENAREIAHLLDKSIPLTATFKSLYSYMSLRVGKTSAKFDEPLNADIYITKPKGRKNGRGCLLSGGILLFILLVFLLLGLLPSFTFYS